MRKLWTLVIMLGLSLSLFACTNDALTNDQITALVNEHVFSTSELAQYTGANGSTAYIAVNGIVYDVTSVFDNGKHQGLQLGGTDATAVFAMSPHSQGLLATLPVVGVYDPNQTIENPTNPTDPQNPTNTTLPVFTLSELSQYTGANGTTAYIAVNGVVYDVTNTFVNGKHQGLQLGGTDATQAFASSPHSASLLSTLPVVGSLEGYPTIDNPSTPTDTTLPVFTLSELSAYTGANGSTAYIAVNGVVYNVTNVFVNGMHQGLQLGGTDATQAFASSPHSASLLATLPVVGSLEGYPTITEPTIPTYPYDDDDDDCDDDDDEYEDEDDDDDHDEYEHEDEDEYEDD